MRPNFLPKFQSVIVLLVLVTSFALQAYLGRQIEIQRTPAEAPKEKPVVWRADLIKPFSVGHWPIVVDWLWIRFLQENEMKRPSSGQHLRSYYLLDLATDLDPAFFQGYYYGANLLAVAQDDIPGAERLLAKGEKFRIQRLHHYPEDFRRRFWAQAYQLPLLRGYINLFEKDDLPAATEDFREAASIEGAPAYLLRLEKRLRDPRGLYEVGLRLVSFLLSSQKDERVKKRLLEKRRSLHISLYLFDINRSFHAFLERQPSYRGKDSFRKSEIEKYWRRFMRALQITKKDPFGGNLFIDKNGRVNSSSSRARVFGVEY